jgi:hypothetical protein
MAFAGSRYGRSQQQSQLPAPHAEPPRGGFTAFTGAALATSPASAARRFYSSGSAAFAAPVLNVRSEPSPRPCPALPARGHTRRTACAWSIGQSAWRWVAIPAPAMPPPWACPSAARRCCTVSVSMMPTRSHRSKCSAWMIGHGARAIPTVTLPRWTGPSGKFKKLPGRTKPNQNRYTAPDDFPCIDDRPNWHSSARRSQQLSVIPARNFLAGPVARFPV